MSVIASARRLGEGFPELSLRRVPGPHVLGILLTVVTVAVASGSRPKATMDARYGGVWTLLSFIVTVSVMLLAGDAIANLRARDSIGYTAVATSVGLVLVCVTVAVFIELA